MGLQLDLYQRLGWMRVELIRLDVDVTSHTVTLTDYCLS